MRCHMLSCRCIVRLAMTVFGVATTLSCIACTYFIGSAVLCWARGPRYVAEPALFTSRAPRSVKSIGPATQPVIYLSTGIPLNDIRGCIKCCTCQSKRASSLSGYDFRRIYFLFINKSSPLNDGPRFDWQVQHFMHPRNR